MRNFSDKKVAEKDAFQKFSDGVRNVPNTLFDFGEDKSQEQDQEAETSLGNFQKSFQGYLDEKPKTIADGVFKGLLSIGSGVFAGITGIVSEPIREVQKKGAIGVVTGVGKGLSGLVTKPLAGVIDMGVKTTQGVINTPGTIVKAFGEDAPVPPPNPIFGVNHDESLMNAEILRIVHPTVSFIDYIRKFGMETEGIFRESGNFSIIKQIVDDYNIGKEPELETLEMREISGVLKQYLRSLPEPLLAFDLYSQFLNVYRSSTTLERDAALYKSLIKSLPPTNRLLLRQLLVTLNEITKNSQINKMTASNLAIVFGPSILRPQSVDAATELFDMPDVTKVVEFIIINYVKLF